MMHIIRQVLPDEYNKYRQHLKNLDNDSKYLRFGFSINDSGIDMLCDRMEQHKQKHVLFCIENDDLEFIGIGHIALEDEMELAFSVLKEYQGKGLGSALMTRCIQWCRTHKIYKGHMVCLPHNQTIKHLCKKHGIKIHTEGGETQGDIELEKPDLVTFVKEKLDNNVAMLDYLSKRSRLFWSFSPENS